MCVWCFSVRPGYVFVRRKDGCVRGRLFSCHETWSSVRVCLFVCCLLRVCVHPSEKFMPGNWDIIGCVFVLGVRAHASKGTGYI